MAHAGLLQRVVGFYEGYRQFALFRLNASAAAVALSSSPPKLPCSRLCKLRWEQARHQQKWDHGHGWRATIGRQRNARPKGCDLVNERWSASHGHTASTP